MDDKIRYDRLQVQGSRSCNRATAGVHLNGDINRLKIVDMRRWFVLLLRHENRCKSIRPQDPDGTEKACGLACARGGEQKAESVKLKTET